MKKLHIENFLLFKEVDIVIKPVTILIGPQATGKSVIAKLIYIFNEFPRIAQEASWEISKSNQEVIDKIKGRMQEIFYKVFSLVFESTWPENMRIVFETDTGKLSFCTDSKNNLIVFDFDNKYIEHLNSYLKDATEFRGGEAEQPQRLALIKLFDEKKPELSESLRYELLKTIIFNGRTIDEELQNSLFIPAGRSYFSVVDINPFSQINETISDYFFRTFAAQYKNALQQIEVRRKLNIPPATQEKNNTLTIEIPNGIVEGEYIFDTEKKKGYIAHKNGLICELKYASSGEQEFLPLFLTLLEGTSRNFIIEEPEAHLFPKSQKEVTRVMLSHKNAAGDVFITTHSPYILASFNNLLYAGIINEKLTPKKKNKLKELIPEKCLVKENSLAAYYIDEGTAQDIIDPETKLIMADVIDKVSDDIDAEFDKIAELGL